MRSKVFVVSVAAIWWAPAALADFTISHNMDIEATGMLAMMGAEGTVTRRISGDKSYTEGAFEPKSSLVAAFSRNMNIAEIVRLDREVTWNLLPDDQAYTETDFATARAQMEQSMAALEQNAAAAEGSGGALPVNSEDCQWSEPVVSASKTGETARVAGQKSEQHIVRVSQTCTEPDTGNQCEISWQMESWLAKKVKGNEEALSFDRAYAEKMGLDEMFPGATAQNMTQPLLSMFSEGWDDAIAELGDFKGYPMKTVLQVEIGGEQCLTDSGQPISMDDVWNDAAEAGLASAAGQAGAQLGSEVGSEVAESMGDSVGGSIAGSAAGAATRTAISGMFSKFSSKRKEKKEAEERARAEAEAAAAAEAEPNPNAQIVLFRISQEVAFVSDDRVPAEKFEIPAGWTKKGG